MRRTAFSRSLFAATLAIVEAMTLAAMTSPAAASGKKHHHPRRSAARATPPTRADISPSQPAQDDLYRRRGYGIGGAFFGADTALAGTCADLRFAEPNSCGRGYGIYGNGLGTQFGR